MTKPKTYDSKAPVSLWDRPSASSQTESAWKAHSEKYGLDKPVPLACNVNKPYVCRNCGQTTRYYGGVDDEAQCPRCGHRPSHSLQGVRGVERIRLLGKVRSLGSKEARAMRRFGPQGWGA